jgi:hypothetical protein
MGVAWDPSDNKMLFPLPLEIKRLSLLPYIFSLPLSTFIKTVPFTSLSIIFLLALNLLPFFLSLYSASKA